MQRKKQPRVVVVALASVYLVAGGLVIPSLKTRNTNWPEIALGRAGGNA